jgi:membrane-associated phospholipid phosphatase
MAPRQRRIALIIGFLVVGGLLGTGCSSDLPESQPTSTTAEPLYPAPVARPAGAPTDVALDWLDLHIDLVRRESLSPPVATRSLAYLALGLEQAFDRATPGGEAFVIAGLEVPSAPDGVTLDPAVAGAVSTATVSRALIASPEAVRSADLLEAQHVDAASQNAESTVAASVAFGKAVGDAVVGFAAADGFDSLPQFRDPPPDRPGQWVPTPPSFAYPLEPFWGDLRPIIAADADCPVPDPVPYDETPGSAFWNEAMAVYDAKAALTPQEKATARYWRDLPGTSFTPAGHWVHIAGRAMETDIAEGKLDAQDVVRTYAALAVAQHDAFLANWTVKYRTDLLRPVTYIRLVRDPAWDSQLNTPPFPAYPSGHSTGSATSATVLTTLLGDRPFTDTAGDLNEYQERSFPSFAAAAAEASNSRLLGGIHFPMDLTAGTEQGRCMAGVVIERLGLGG